MDHLGLLEIALLFSYISGLNSSFGQINEASFLVHFDDLHDILSSQLEDLLDIFGPPHGSVGSKNQAFSVVVLNERHVRSFFIHILDFNLQNTLIK